MSRWAETDLPCPCGDGKSSYAVDKEGSGYCFKCDKFFFGKKETKVEKDSVVYQFVEYRKIKPRVFEKYKARAGVSKSTSEVVFIELPYPNGRTLVRHHPKSFHWEGEKVGEGSLFGQDVFPAGGRAITVTEGAFDAMSVYQMFGEKYPAVAVTSASSAKKECSEAYKYLDSFEKIYICFDADAPGQEAAKEVARLFDFNKVYIVKMGHGKDANDYLMEGKSEIFQKEWWSATRFLPEGILSSFSEFDKIIDDDEEKPSVPFPFEKLQRMTYGIRTGEMILITAQEGMGKTEIFRALEYHLLKNTDENIGIIHLEESKARTLKGLAGYELKAPIHLPDFSIPKEELKNTLRKVAGRDERIHIYSHFGSDDPDVILSTVRFLAGACGCKRIFLDHITMVVSGLQSEDERKALDYISTRLAMMVEELDFTLFMISHVNDEGKTRGSRNIGKVADLRIDMFRDLSAENEDERNTTHLYVTKNRYAGKTGPAGRLKFDPETYMLSEEEELPDPSFGFINSSPREAA